MAGDSEDLLTSINRQINEFDAEDDEDNVLDIVTRTTRSMNILHHSRTSPTDSRSSTSSKKKRKQNTRSNTKQMKSRNQNSDAEHTPTRKRLIEDTTPTEIRNNLENVGLSSCKRAKEIDSDLDVTETPRSRRNQSAKTKSSIIESLKKFKKKSKLTAEKISKQQSESKDSTPSTSKNVSQLKDKTGDQIDEIHSLEEEKKKYQALIDEGLREINELKAEYRDVESKSIAVEADIDIIQTCLSRYPDRGREKIQTAIGNLKKQISLTSEQTGVKIHDVCTSLKKDDERECIWDYVVIGSSYDTTFEINYLVQEEKGEESIARISGLKINLPETSLELDDGVTGYEDSNALNEFITQILQPFSKWARDREKLFQYLTEKYPNLCQILGPQVLSIKNEEKPGADWLIVWKFRLDALTETRLLPDIQLHVCAPTSMWKLDENGALQNTPEKFRKLVKKLGVTKAVETLINAIK
ncbi:unnamed protein product [Owenia fusiformis]|uniref:Uncharacterized protein n=1 Tax=Owenia fusiformis TaxID=6347 RepID=A0A8J1T681_OWEFU|nr:unnamed protein product [Owenia fusiformis]